ncbi:MAG: mleA [Blastococcus sp.]|nr:mleA [Blastococcus sp.]
MIDSDRVGEPGPGPVSPLPSAWALAGVTGPSMSPTVRSGDRLLVRRVRSAAAVRPGDVVLARFPSRPELLVVKRVRRAVPGGHWVEGDNPFVTDDSRAFGVAVVVGRVVARVYPRPGRLPPAPDRALPGDLTEQPATLGDYAPVSMGGNHDEQGPSADRFADDPAFAVHEGGKLSVVPTRPINSIADLALTYTPGVARVSSAIAAEPELARRFTWASRLVAVVSDGSAVLGLGNIGPAASLPVMEGKACLFAEFAGLSAVPIVLSTNDVDEMVAAVEAIAPSFGGINLEDISAPRCFEIEARLRESLDIPVMHDDQHGTAIVVLAALRNAAKVVGRPLADLRVVVSGAGAAGVACTKILLEAGIGDIAVADSKGILHSSREDLTPTKQWLVENTNRAQFAGTMLDALRGADVYLGLSGGSVPESAIATMAPGCIVFSLANPIPEVDPAMAAKYASVVATGRSDLPNQINNVLAFPGVFRGAIDAGAHSITEAMKLAAATAIADVVGDELRPDYVVPSPLDRRVAAAVAEAVAACAREEGVTA